MKSERLELTYEIEDGYSGGARPQHCQIDHYDIFECETLDQAVKLAEDYIQEDFQQKAYPSYNEDDLRSKVEEIWNQRPKDE